MQSVSQSSRTLVNYVYPRIWYVRRAQAHHHDLTRVLALHESAFNVLFTHFTTDAAPSRQEGFRSRTAYFFQELKRVGITRQLLWQEYRREYSNGYGYITHLNYPLAFTSKDKLCKKTSPNVYSHRPY